MNEVELICGIIKLFDERKRIWVEGRVRLPSVSEGHGKTPPTGMRGGGQPNISRLSWVQGPCVPLHESG